MAMPTVSDKTFDLEVLQSAEPVLVDFFAEWCGPCKAMAPALEQVAHEMKGKVKVVKLDVDQNPTVTGKYGIRAMPTLLLFKNGKEVARYTGYNGEKSNFWKWLGFQLLSPEQQKIAFKQGTEPPFTASNLDEKRPGRFVDPVTGATIFYSNTKFESGTGPVSSNRWKTPLPCTKTTHTA